MAAIAGASAGVAGRIVTPSILASRYRRRRGRVGREPVTVFAGGCVGAGGWPWGTFVANLAGAFVLGWVAAILHRGRRRAFLAFTPAVVAGAELDGDTRRHVAVGFLGAYTTFSTWMLDSDRLQLQRHDGAAALNVLGSLVLGFAALWLGYALG